MQAKIGEMEMSSEERQVHDAVFDRVRGRMAAWLMVALVAAAFWLDSLHLWDNTIGQLIGAAASIPTMLGVWGLADRVANREAQAAVRQLRLRQ